MHTHRIAAMGGDGIGPEVVDAAIQALKVCAERDGGFALLDTQFLTPHLSQFGAHEVSRADYKRRLNAATGVAATWSASPGRAVLEAEFRAMRPDGAAR